MWLNIIKLYVKYFGSMDFICIKIKPQKIIENQIKL